MQDKKIFYKTFLTNKMHSILFVSILLFFSSYCSAQSSIIPIESKSGLYEIRENNEIIKVESLRFSMIFPEKNREDIENSNYFFSITIGNNKACKLIMTETQDSIHIKCQYLYLDQSEITIPKSSFKETSNRKSEYYSLFKNSLTRINFYQTIPLYLIINYPLIYQDKTCIMHLKPDFL